MSTPSPSSPRQAAGPPSRLSLLGQLVLIPLVIVAIGVSVFILFGTVAGGRRTPESYLREIRGGQTTRRWQAAFELARELRQLQGRVDPSLVPEIIETLEWSRSEDPQIRRYLAQALGSLGDARAVPALVEALTDTDADTRLWAATALGSLGDRTALEPLSGLLGDADPGVRKQAVHSLGSLGDASATAVLRPALEDPVVDVRWNAALSLAWLGDETGIPVLLQMIDVDLPQQVPELRPDQAEQVMVGALDALGRLGVESARAPVQELSTGAESLRVRQAALRALTRLDSADGS